jgi:fido (protein-threonine AMPylation protein)
MEGLDITVEQAAEIVTDLRLNMENSEYCREENEAFLSIAGHYDMYQEIFAVPVKNTLSIYDIFALNKKLFSHYPYPEFGGNVRQNNTLVLGAKFETADYHDIFSELAKVDEKVKHYYERREDLSMSEYVKHVVRVHHKVTAIHPFPEGNGRTSRAFMNVQLVRAGMMPVYIKVEDKADYIKALARADELQDYDELYVSYDYRNPIIITVYRALTEKISNIEYGSRIPSVTAINDEYVNQWGLIVSDGNFAHSQPIEVVCGELIDFYGKGWDRTTAMIATCDSDGNNIVPKVIAPDHEVRHYLYTVKEDGYIILSYDYRTATSLVVTKADTVVSMKTRLNEIDGKINSGISVNLLTAFDNITCIGDSLTYSQVYTGQYTSRQAYVPYPKALGRKTGADYQILATPGKTASEIWDEYNNQIITRANDLTIVYRGTNGGLTDTIDTDCVGNDYTQYANTNTGRYGCIIKKSLDAGNKVVLVKIHSGSTELTNSVIEKFAAKFNVPFIENEYFQERCYHIYPDGTGQNAVHYNDFGYNKFADYVIGQISSLDNDDLVKILSV